MALAANIHAVSRMALLPWAESAMPAAKQRSRTLARLNKGTTMCAVGAPIANSSLTA